MKEFAMKRHLVAVVAASLALGAGGQALAQSHMDGHDTHGAPAGGHADWRKGGHIAQSDWARGQQVDWQSHHLHRPPSGYEWREVDGNYVLAAVATGLIASLVLSGH
jgi:Ni/Co efflux regulator RcnB